MIDLEIPEWLRPAFTVVVILSTILIFIIALMVVHHFTQGPPKTCGSSGVFKVLPETSDSDLAIVCNNGRTYYP